MSLLVDFLRRDGSTNFKTPKPKARERYLEINNPASSRFESVARPHEVFILALWNGPVAATCSSQFLDGSAQNTLLADNDLFVRMDSRGNYLPEGKEG